MFQIGVGHRPLADKNWKLPILSERSGQNGLSKLENPAQMARPIVFMVFRPRQVLVRVLEHYIINQANKNLNNIYKVNKNLQVQTVTCS